jgi:hypothetical protein
MAFEETSASQRNGEHMATLRRELFAEGKYPGSTMITVSNFAQPGC